MPTPRVPIRPFAFFAAALVALGAIAACAAPAADSGDTVASAAPSGGQSAVKDTESQPDVVKVAAGSPDHSTLVAAIQAASLVDALSNAGPFTVFAPTNAAFDKLPAGTVDNLLKPENKSQLKTILQHHVTTSALSIDFFQDGQSYGMVDGTRETFTMKNGAAYMGSAKIIASVRASNGWVHVVDAVLVPTP